MSPPANEGRFPTTCWTLVARLKSSDEDAARRALDDLCAQYHYPLYCYIRRRGLHHYDAQDALHDFLAKLLRTRAFEDAEPEKGHLRAFLSTALHRFLINWHEHTTQRRREVSMDAGHLSDVDAVRFEREKFTELDTPDRVFERKWAQVLLMRALTEMATIYAERGKADLFEVLRPVILQGGSLRGEYPAALAAKLGITETTLRKALQRALSDYRKVLEKEVLQTVASADQVEDEITYLRALFGER